MALRATVTSLPSLLGSHRRPPADPGAAVDPTRATDAGRRRSRPPARRLLVFPVADARNGEERLLRWLVCDAISGFESLLRAFPRTEAAGEAQYWLGKSIRSRSDGRTRERYTTVIQSYSKSMWVPEAFYKRGLAQEQLKQTDLARASYEC